MQFDYIKIETIFNDKSKTHVMPNSLDTFLLPLNPAQFSYTEFWEVDDDE